MLAAAAERILLLAGWRAAFSSLGMQEDHLRGAVGNHFKAKTNWTGRQGEGPVQGKGEGAHTRRKTRVMVEHETDKSSRREIGKETGKGKCGNGDRVAKRCYRSNAIGFHRVAPR